MICFVPSRNKQSSLASDEKSATLRSKRAMKQFPTLKQHLIPEKQACGFEFC